MLNKNDLKKEWINKSPQQFYNWFGNYLTTLKDDQKRTPQQSKSLHLWLNMIEHEAENQGVTWNQVIRHTSQLRITSEGLKSALKQLIKALWGYTSTTQIKKVGELEIVIDHMTDWLSKEMEVPAFPSEDHKQNIAMMQVNNRSNTDYPEYNGSPTI